MGDEKKNTLLDLLQRAEEKASGLENIGHQIVQDARFSQDVARCMQEVVGALPSDEILSPEQWGRSLSTWQDWHKGAAHLESAQTSVGSFTALASGAGLTMRTIFDEISNARKQSSQGIIAPAASRFSQIINKNQLASEVKSAMVRLGLDVGW